MSSTPPTGVAAGKSGAGRGPPHVQVPALNVIAWARRWLACGVGPGGAQRDQDVQTGSSNTDVDVEGLAVTEVRAGPGHLRLRSQCSGRAEQSADIEQRRRDGALVHPNEGEGRACCLVGDGAGEFSGRSSSACGQHPGEGQSPQHSCTYRPVRTNSRTGRTRGSRYRRRARRHV